MIGTTPPTFPQPAAKSMGGANFYKEPSSPLDHTNETDTDFKRMLEEGEEEMAGGNDPDDVE